MQLNDPYVKRILHLVPFKIIIFRSSYNCIYHWLFVLIILSVVVTPIPVTGVSNGMAGGADLTNIKYQPRPGGCPQSDVSGLYNALVIQITAVTALVTPYSRRCFLQTTGEGWFGHFGPIFLQNVNYLLFFVTLAAWGGWGGDRQLRRQGSLFVILWSFPRQLKIRFVTIINQKLGCF